MILLELFWTFFKIGAFTFGGGYAMIPLIQSEVVSNGWMSMEQLINFIAVSESTPGPLAVNMATYVGSETAGIIGSVCATFGVVLPSFIIILLVARVYTAFSNNKYVKGCMNGLKAAVIGLIVSSVLSVGQTVFFEKAVSLQVLSSTVFWCSAGILVIDIVLSIKKANPIMIILLSAALGIAAGYGGLL
jgi:chromate transporter